MSAYKVTFEIGVRHLEVSISPIAVGDKRKFRDLTRNVFSSNISDQQSACLCVPGVDVPHGDGLLARGSVAAACDDSHLVIFF